MALVVDSCILLDVALNDPEFGYPSAKLLDQKKSEGLVVCPISIIEIVPEFNGSLAEVRNFLSLLGIDHNQAWLEVDSEVSANAWSRYVALKRQKLLPKRPIADILIGGFACRFGGLISRNLRHFEPYFPKLSVISPV